MITKGIIEEVLSDNKVKVRCPVLDKIPSADLSNNNLNIAIICTLPGIYINPRKGDIVFVGFENENFSLPIVLGYLFLNDGINSSNSLQIGSLTVNKDISLPKNTTIGSINWNEIYTLKNLSNNLKETFNNLDNDIEENENSINNLQSTLDKIENILNEIENFLKKESFNVDELKNLIGNFGDTDSSSLFGKVYSIINTLNNIEKYLGNFSKENTLENQLSKIDSMIDSISNYSASTTPVFNDEPNCMLARAERMITVTWKPKYSFNKWNSSEKFIAGQTYMGMPYTMFSGGYKYDAWKKHAEDNISTTGSIPGYGERIGPLYGSCCADFVSETLGLPTHQRSCLGLSGQTKYLKKLTGEDAKASRILAGDVLLATSGNHVMWVGNVNGDILTIYEQNPPLAHKFTLSISNNTKNGFIYWGSEYGVILRPTEELLALEQNVEIDNSVNILDNWVYKGFHYNTDISKMLLTEKEYINNGLIFWKLCKKAGWTAEAAAGCWSNTFGESSGNPWSYGTAGGGILGYTPFDFGYNGAGIYDYAKDILGDAEKRWDGNVQVDYINWLIDRVRNHTLYAVFSIRKPTTKYWNYTPPSTTSIPTNNFDIDTYIKLNKKDYGATATICANLWLARAGVVDLDYANRRTQEGLNHVITSHNKKAEELYQLFLKY